MNRIWPFSITTLSIPAALSLAIGISTSTHAEMQLSAISSEHQQIQLELTDQELSNILIDGALESTASGELRSLPANKLIKSRKLEGHQRRFRSALKAEYPEAERRLRAAFKEAEKRRMNSQNYPTAAEMELILEEQGKSSAPKM